MILVLCDAGDEGALWAAAGLHARGRQVTVVQAEALVGAETVEHRLGGRDAGAPVVAIRLRDGRRIASDTPAAVLNRLSFLPPAAPGQVAEDDRDYAVQEMNALYLSWLEAMPGPVVNRPAPQGLGGAWRHPAHWIALAARAGLPVVPWSQSDESDPDGAWAACWRPATLAACVVGDAVVAPGALPAGFEEGLRRMAATAGTALLGVMLEPDAAGGWRVSAATPRPDLRAGGAAMLDALDQCCAHDPPGQRVLRP